MNNFSHDKPCVDHKGNIFGNIKSMCRFWHINPKTFSRRMNVYGMTLEEALTKPLKSNSRIKTMDHRGEVFPSRTSMCKYWGIPRKTYEDRILNGWNIKEALTVSTDRKDRAFISKEL